MRLFLFTILAFPAILFSQNNRFFFVEAGSNFNTKLDKNFHTKDPQTSTTSFEYKGTIHSLPSYYVKAGVEKNFRLCNVSSISFPISLGYYNEAQNIKAYGGYSGCFGGEWGNYDIIRNNHFAILSLGIKLTKSISEKFSIQNAVSYNHNLLVCQENNFKITNETGVHSYYFNNFLTRSYILLSSQSGVFYQYNSKTKIGLTAEYFFFNRSALPKNTEYLSYDIYDFEQGYKGYSAMLNIGLKLEHSF